MTKAQSHTESVKEKIINTTIKLIEQKGYYNVGVREICRVSEISLSRVNYHFGSKDNMILEIAKMIPYAIDEGFKKRKIDGAVSCMPFSMPFMIMMVKIIFSNSIYAQRYREIYSQPFVKEYISKSYEDSFKDIPYIHSQNHSYEMRHLLANACGNCITSLADESLFNTLKGDVDSTVEAVCKFNLSLINLPEDEQNRIFKEALELVSDIHFELTGITQIKFY